MNNIEEDLKRALRRQDPPADLVGKIMNRVGSGRGLEPEPSPEPGKVLGFRPKPKVMVWLAGAAAAACLVGLFVTRSYMADRGKTLVPGSGPASAWSEPPSGAQPQPGGNQVTAQGAKDDKSNIKQNLVGTSGGERRHHIKAAGYHRRAGSYPAEAARQAEEQLKLALAITSAKLGYAQRSIQEADGSSTPDREVDR
jgi:hypothetical protein